MDVLSSLSLSQPVAAYLRRWAVFKSGDMLQETEWGVK